MIVVDEDPALVSVEYWNLEFMPLFVSSRFMLINSVPTFFPIYNLFGNQTL